MRIKIFTLILCTLYFLPVSAQFTWSNPQPSGYINTNIIFTDSNTGYIINTNGDLIKTIDQGNTWAIQQNFPGCSVLKYSDSVFVIGGADSTIYISTDLTHSWTKSVIPNYDIAAKIQIVNRDTFYVATPGPSFTTLYGSVDQGKTWKVVNTTLAIRSMDFVNSKIGYATSYQGVYKTVDGGKTWNNVYSPTGGYSFINVKFCDEKNGLAYQDHGQLVRTNDGGATWTIYSVSPTNNIQSIFYVDAKNVFIAGEYGVIYNSIDSGKTWQLRPANHMADGYTINSMYFLNSNIGFAVGYRGRIEKTTDAGLTWQDYAPNYIDIKPLSFPTDTIGYAASWTELFKTTDAGGSWAKLPLTTTGNSRFQYLNFFSKDTGIAFADSPVQLYKTYDGGQTWTTLQLPVLYKDYITSCYFLNDTGYININGAYGYTILQTTDRGESWKVQLQDVQGGYQNLFFVDVKTGYGTMGPYLYKTTDSAKSWTFIKSNDISSFSGLWFTSPANGYAVGGNGGNYRTNDSGKTWNQFMIAPDNYNFDDVYAIRFFNQKLGYLVSKWGGIYRTADGGDSWKADKSAPLDCKTIVMTNNGFVYIAGTYGIILKKDMREYWVDSLRVVSDDACGSLISAKIAAALTTVDSAWFEYGKDKFTNTVAAISSQIVDSVVRATIDVEGLSADSTYKVRLKTYYHGNYYYSDSIYFTPTGLAKPLIYINGSTLISSASTGNQWYLNNVPIAGANATTYQPAISGAYTVQQKFNNCSGPISEPFNYVVTAIGDLVPDHDILVFPNPVHADLWIQNKDSKKLHIQLIDQWGRIVRELDMSNTKEIISVQHLNSGIYTLLIKNSSTHKVIRTKLVKL